MSYKVMQPAQVQDGGERGRAFEISESLSAAGSTDDILIPDDVQNISVTAESSGATVIVYTTTDPIAAVKSGTGVTWLAWTAGAISAATGASFNPVTAIKMIQTGAGTSKLTMRAQ